RASAAKRLAAACWADPFMVAGTGRFDNEVMTALGSRIFTKGGAEGVFCAAFPGPGFGIAIKCDDGAGRAAEVLTGNAIAAFLPDVAEDYSRQPVLSRRNQKVGEIR